MHEVQKAYTPKGCSTLENKMIWLYVKGSILIGNIDVLICWDLKPYSTQNAGSILGKK